MEAERPNGMSSILKRVLSHIESQVGSDDAQSELSKMEPAEIDWPVLVADTVDRLVPKLVGLAPKLRDRLHLVFRGPVELKEKLTAADVETAIQSAARHDASAGEILRRMQSECMHLADGAIELVTEYLVAQQITKVVEDFMRSPDGLGTEVRLNGASSYPDVYFADHVASYSRLAQQRAKGVAVHGPCRNGRNQPSKVPDGLEVKTKRGRSVRIDCHAPNPGLHLVITWDDKTAFQVGDLWLAFVCASDYSECSRNASATTVKFSFGPSLFISLLRGER